MKNHISRPKNVIFERFKHLSKFHFPACTTLVMTHEESDHEDLDHEDWDHDKFTVDAKYSDQDRC